MFIERFSVFKSKTVSSIKQSQTAEEEVDYMMSHLKSH